MRKTDKGVFTPKNPHKIMGDSAKIIYRSSWELSAMMMLDSHPAVIAWGSECIKIPYQNPIKGRWSIYIPDFVVVFTDKAGQQHVEVWEVKPIKETPNFRRKTKSGREVKLTEADAMKQTINAYKWASARHYCKPRGWNFRVITERDLFGR